LLLKNNMGWVAFPCFQANELWLAFFSSLAFYTSTDSVSKHRMRWMDDPSTSIPLSLLSFFLP
jgi:hypothetical protein